VAVIPRSRAWPDDPEAHYNLGHALEIKGNRQGAINEYSAALKASPHDPQIRENYERLSRELEKKP